MIYDQYLVSNTRLYNIFNVFSKVEDSPITSIFNSTFIFTCLYQIKAKVKHGICILTWLISFSNELYLFMVTQWRHRNSSAYKSNEWRSTVYVWDDVTSLRILRHDVKPHPPPGTILLVYFSCSPSAILVTEHLIERRGHSETYNEDSCSFYYSLFIMNYICCITSLLSLFAYSNKTMNS